MARRSILLVATLVAALVVPLTSAGAEQAPDRSTWIVTLRPGSPATQNARPLAGAYGGEVQHVYEHVLNGFSFVGSAAAADALRRNPTVETVTPDRPVHLVGETGPWGILRISAWAAHQAGYVGRTANGTKVRIAIVDSGIMASHVDLAPNVATAEGKNCISGGAPDDDHGHGTHVAGSAAASFTGVGVVGVATDARLTAVKVVDATGNGSDSQVICGLDHVAGLAAADGVPTVVNLSLGEGGRPGETACTSSPLHQAVCTLVNDRHVTVVAAAGNDGGDAGSFVPAAFPEVIAVSAFADFDGARSSSGCEFFPDILWACDDTLTDFSNYGSVVDVAAPGAEIYSTYNDGAWTTMSGTSMASPHVAGTAALVLGANPSLTPAQVRSLLMRTGECPDGARADSSGTCAGHGQWTVGSLFGNYADPDGIAEPLVNAYEASTNAGTPPPAGNDVTPPTVTITAPAANAVVKGTVAVSATASDDVGVAAVEFYDGAALIGTTDTTAPFGVQWPTSGYGGHTLTAKAYDAAGNATTSTAIAVTVDNAAPTVSVSSPADGSTVGGSVALRADAADVGSAVSKVDFLVDNAVVGSSTGPSYGYDWNSASAANGSHAITAVATDAAGNTTSSAAVNVTVQNATPAITMSVDNLVAWGKKGSRSWTTWAEVWVVDQTGAPVSGAVVTLAVTGGATATRSCTTNTSGYCSTSRNKVSVPNTQSSVVWETTNVAKNGASWDGVRWRAPLTKP